MILRSFAYASLLFALPTRILVIDHIDEKPTEN